MLATVWNLLMTIVYGKTYVGESVSFNVVAAGSVVLESMPARYGVLLDGVPAVCKKCYS